MSSVGETKVREFALALTISASRRERSLARRFGERRSARTSSLPSMTGFWCCMT
jgi:hypothetical protein